MAKIDEKDLIVIGGISQVNWALNRAKRLLSIAKNSKSDDKLLSACSVLISGAALELMTQERLSILAATQSVEEDMLRQKTPAGKLLFESLKNRVRMLPDIISNRRFVFNHDCQKASDLYEVISLRNKLLHIEDAMLIQKGTSGHIVIHDGFVENFFPIPDDIWDSIDSNKAQRLLEAVSTYFEEVVTPGEIKGGQLVCPSS